MILLGPTVVAAKLATGNNLRTDPAGGLDNPDEFDILLVIIRRAKAQAVYLL